MFTKADMTATILSNSEVAPCHYLMTLAVSKVFGQAQPGQFVMLRPEGRGFPSLGRPLGIYSLGGIREWLPDRSPLSRRGEGDEGHLGTVRRGSHRDPGSTGEPVEHGPGMKTAVLVAGGIGIAPLVFLAEKLSLAALPERPRMILYIGAKDSSSLLGIDRMKTFGVDVRVSTDDGSAGYRGPVTDLFRKDLASLDASKTEAFVCGPNPMLKRMSEIVADLPSPVRSSWRSAWPAAWGPAWVAPSKSARHRAWNTARSARTGRSLTCAALCGDDAEGVSDMTVTRDSDR